MLMIIQNLFIIYSSLVIDNVRQLLQKVEVATKTTSPGVNLIKDSFPSVFLSECILNKINVSDILWKEIRLMNGMYIKHHL